MAWRFIRTLAFLLCLGGIGTCPCPGQDVDPTRAKTLTVEQAHELVARPGSLRLAVAELSPEAAAVLAGYKGELRFEGLTTLSPEAAAALATREGTLELAKLNALPPAVAKALAAHTGELLLMGVTELTPEAVEALATHSGTLELGVTELSDELAAALAKHPGEIRLRSLKNLASLTLAERLGRQEHVYLDSVAHITPEIATALCPPSNREKFKNHAWLIIGLTELPADVAAAIMAGRSHLQLDRLESIADEAAAAWSGPFANIRLPGLKTISPAAAVSLTKGEGIFDIRYYGPEISTELAEALAKQMVMPPARMVDLNGLKRLSSPALALAALRREGHGAHSQLFGVAEITDDVAAAIAESKDTLNALRGLTSLTSARLAAKYAAQPNDVDFRTLTGIPDDVAVSLAAHKGKVDLSGLQSLSAEAAKAFAGHDGELKLNGLQEITDEAATALAQAKGQVSLAGLAKASPAAVAALKANPGISLPATLAAP